MAAKVGLEISFEKTKFTTNDKNDPNIMKVKNGIIQRVEEFKYLGEMIQVKAGVHIIKSQYPEMPK